MHSRTLGEILCNRGAARRFGLRMARKAEKPAAVLQRDYDFARGEVDLCDLAPGDAQIQSAAEFQPATREKQMTIQVGAPASKANGRHEVALIAGCERIRRRDDRQIALPQTIGEIGTYVCASDLVGTRGTLHVNPKFTSTALPYRF